MENTEENVVVEAEAVEAAEVEHAEEVEPRGAATFVILMGAFYVIYWVISWIEIFATRGS